MSTLCRQVDEVVPLGRLEYPCSRFIPHGLVEPVVGRGVIILPGAGTAAAERYQPLASDLAERGMCTFTFDYIGQGQSKGSLKEQSLQTRYEQFISLVDYLGMLDCELTLVSFSMSGQTVADVIGRSDINVRNAVLCAPAAYSETAWPLRFDAGFTEEIRKPDSWRSSSAFQYLAAFRGRSALVVPEFDNVIPRGVSDAYEACMRSGDDFQKWVPAGSDHNLGSWFANSAVHRKTLIDLIAR